MKCKFCGNEIPMGARFCDECGTAVEEAGGGINLSKNGDGMLDITAPNAGMSNSLNAQNDMNANQPQQFGGQPQYGQPQQFGGQPQYSQPQQFGGQPQYGQPQQFGNQQYGQPQYGNQQQYGAMAMGMGMMNTAYNEGDGSPRYVGFVDAIKLFFKNFVNFTGRSTRSEFWFVMLAEFVFSFALGIPCLISMKEYLSDISNWFDLQGFFDKMLGWSILYSIVGLALFLPNLSLLVRRLHDSGIPGWSIVIWIIASALCSQLPFLLLVLLVLYIYAMCRESQGANKWGPAPNPNRR